MTQKSREYDALFAELLSVLGEKTEAAIAARTTLRDAVCAFVEVERARGMPLETVIQVVKELLSSAETDSASTSDVLAIQLVAWCVEFHGSSESAGPKVSGQLSLSPRLNPEAAAS